MKNSEKKFVIVRRVDNYTDKYYNDMREWVSDESEATTFDSEEEAKKLFEEKQSKALKTS